MKFDYSKIEQKKEELERYEGYLPAFITFIIDCDKYIEFLKEKGIYNDVMKIMSKAKHYTIEEDVEDMIRWVNENPEYQYFLIE